MREEETETCTLTFDGVLEPPRSYVWQDVLRHSFACEMLARQVALREAGPNHQAYLKKHRERLMNEASQLIEGTPGYARWRLRCDGEQKVS